MVLTGVLQKLIENYRQILTPSELHSFVSEIQDRLKQHIEIFEQQHNGPARARLVHRLLEVEIAKASDVEVTCKKGCGFCCHLEIDISTDEAQLLAKEILDNKVAVDLDKLRDQSLRERRAMQWMLGAIPGNACAFLGPDNACKVYESRPSICRKHSVTSEPQRCVGNDGEPAIRVIPNAEIILAAYRQVSGVSFNSFASQLWKALEDRLDQDDLHLLSFNEDDLSLNQNSKSSQEKIGN